MTSIIEMNSTAEITDQINFDKNEQIQPDSPTVAEIITNITSSLTTSLKQFLSVQDDFIWCPVKGCGFVFENSGPGEDEIQTFDEEMSEQAKNHYNHCRFRCRKCTETFCSECKAVPYHFGFTCAELRVRNETVLCRFCEAPLPEVKMSDHLQAIEAGSARVDHCSTCGSNVWKISTEKFANCKHANYYYSAFWKTGECQCLDIGGSCNHSRVVFASQH